MGWKEKREGRREKGIKEERKRDKRRGVANPLISAKVAPDHFLLIAE